MGAETKIQWTTHTFNTHWGCTRVSPGCTNCYAETLANRWGTEWGPKAERRLFGDKHWAEPLKWNRAAEKANERARVFCASMGDVFEARDELDHARERLWALIASTPMLDWQLLTKRPENIKRMVPWGARWPVNVWIGTTVEDQRRADERLPHLVRCPAAVRFVSAEPLLEPVDMRFWLGGSRLERRDGGGWMRHPDPDIGKHGGTWWFGVDWVIVGGESGGGARQFDVRAAFDVVSQCKAANVPCFVKQMGAQPFDGRGPLRLRSRKGDDTSEWPDGLRIREMPAA